MSADSPFMHCRPKIVPKIGGRSQSGATLVEYALLLSLIGLLAISSLPSLATGITGVFDNAQNAAAACPQGQSLMCSASAVPIGGQAPPTNTSPVCFCTNWAGVRNGSIQD